MIKNFKHKGLKELFEAGKSAKISSAIHVRCLRRLDALNAAKAPDDMNIQGFDFHKLKRSGRYTVHVNGPWCVTFDFKEGNAIDVDLEQYH